MTRIEEPITEGNHSEGLPRSHKRGCQTFMPACRVKAEPNWSEGKKNTVWKYFWVLICGLLFEAIILVNKFSARQSDLSHHLHTHIFNVLLCIFLAKILHVHVALCGLICGMDNFGLICKGNENDYPEIR